MKKSLFLIVFLIALGIFIFQPMSYSGRDGETLFLNKCGNCHSESGEAPIFGPVKYASSQWERFFKRKKHNRKKDISGEVTDEELAIIKEYLIDHAADSDRPIAAGLR